MKPINDAITLVAWFKMTSVVTGSANLGGDAASRTALVGKYLVRLCPWAQMARIQWSCSFTNTPWTRLVQEYCRRQNMSPALELAFRLIFFIVQIFTGALMGAIHGYTEIPLEWRVELQDYEVQFLWRLFLFSQSHIVLTSVIEVTLRDR
jgi:hypothetical protein